MMRTCPEMGPSLQEELGKKKKKKWREELSKEGEKGNLVIRRKGKLTIGKETTKGFKTKDSFTVF